MPHRARPSLAALALCLALGVPPGIPAAFAEPAPSGSAWTDPPVRRPDAEKPTAEAPRAAPPEPTPAPRLAATPKAGAPSPRPARKAAVPRPRERPVAVAPRRTRVAVAARIRAARPPRTAAPASRAPRDEAFAGYRPYGTGYGPLYADDRLERLRAAEAAGFLVVRRHAVEFPDGRTLRTYRPLGDGDGF